MDHAEALKTKATEKYFLGELTPQQREAYENHYFDCHECAADVKSTALLMDNAREIFHEEPAPPCALRGFRRFPVDSELRGLPSPSGTRRSFRCYPLVCSITSWAQNAALSQLQNPFLLPRAGSLGATATCAAGAITPRE